MAMNKQDEKEIRLIINEEIREVFREIGIELSEKANEETRKIVPPIIQNYVFPAISRRVEKIQRNR